LNFVPGQVVPNSVLSKVGRGGKVCLFSLAQTDVAVDVNGYAPAAGSPIPLVPARLLETRSGAGLSTVDGLFRGGGRVGARSVTELTVAGRGGVPADASAVMLNVTAISPLARGFITVYPCGSAVPNASNLNFVPGQVVPNSVLSKVGRGGKVCLFSLAQTDVAVDVNGYVRAGK
jgi:hypothetical protein